MTGLLLAAALALAAPADLPPAACVPVQVEAPLSLPRADRTGPGCIAYQRVPHSGNGDPARMLVFGDPQVKSARDMDYFRRDIVAPLVGKHDAMLGLTLGDLVDDQPTLLQDVKAATASLGIPWLHAPGNHDVDHDATSDADSLGTFHRAIGPDTVARQTALANIAVLDDVIAMPGRKPAYIGGLREDQFAFLERWLPTLRKDRLLVLAMHIHLFDEVGKDSFRDADRERLFALLKSFPHVLVLTAHSHTQRHVFHGADTGWHGATPLHEYNVGAACGSYWSGAADAQGIPAATMPDGTPNGYAMLTVRQGGEYALAWHNARDADDRQIGLHAPNVLRRGAYPAWGVFANVYMGMDDTRVEFRVDGGAWMPMKKVLRPDPALQAENALDDAAKVLRGFDRSPEAEVSTHLWRGALPTTLAAGEHVIEVRAFDRWRGEVRARTTYRLEDFVADTRVVLRSQADLDAYLAVNKGRDTSFDLLPPLTRQRFLSSLRFGSKGLGGFGVDDLAMELTPAEVERVLALFDVAEYAKMVPSRHQDGPPAWRVAALLPGRAEMGFDVLHRIAEAASDDSGKLHGAFAELFGAMPQPPEALARMPDRELIFLLRSVELTMSVAVTSDDVERMRLIVAEMQRRRIAQTSDLASVLDAMLKVRRFEDARHFAREHAHAGLPSVPAMLDNIGSNTSMPTVWRASRDGAIFTRTPLDLGRTSILVTAGCHFSVDAAEDLSRDPLLGPVFAEHAHWLVLPPGDEKLDAIRDWNRRFPQAQAEPIHDRLEWASVLPGGWEMPVFFVVRDGRIVERITGWPRNPASNRQALIDTLTRTGLLERP